MMRSRQNLALEVVIRVTLAAIFIVTDDMEPFRRVIQPEEWWLYKNPRTDSYFTSTYLLVTVIVICPLLIVIIALLRRDFTDMLEGLLAYSFSVSFTGVLTNVVKLMVGRPRPDFFYRCFKNGVATKGYICNGIPAIIREGLKSFPSGHSSFISSACLFLTFYIAGKLHAFEGKGRRSLWRFLICFCPVCFSLIVAISRTMDYHHHYQDVTVGYLLGSAISYIVYHQIYPPLSSLSCDHPLGYKVPTTLPRTLSEASIFKKSYEPTLPLEIKEM